MTSDPSSNPEKLMAEAWAALQAGQRDLAESLLYRVLVATPQNIQARFALGRAAQARGDIGQAIELIQGTLKYQPRFQPAITLLALLYMQIGDFEQAGRFAKKGLLAEPNHVECLKVLGRCSVVRADYQAALESFDKAIRLVPTDAQALFARGTVLKKLHRVVEALEAFEEAARLSPEPEAFVELAEMQSLMAKTEESIQSCRQALAAAPNSFKANLHIAQALTDQNRLDEAETYWAACEANEPIAAHARVLKSMHYAKIGRFEDAEAEAARAIELNPKSGRPYQVLFSSRKVTAADQTRIDQIEALLSDSGVADEERVDMLYALGKAYDNLAEYGSAIKKFDEANALQRRVMLQNRPFDRDHLQRTVDQQVKMFTKSRLDEVGGTEPDLPLFVIGMPRSGTTLVDQILSSHPQVGSVGEQAFWLDYEDSVVSYDRNELYVNAANKAKKTYLELLSCLAPGFSQVVDKNPGNLTVGGLLHVLFPSSRMICARRHAVDTALSIWMTPMQTQAPFVCDRSNIVFAYKQCLRLMDHWRDTMPSSRYLEISYESLSECPEAHTRQMVEFCGLPWSDDCLHPERNSREVNTPSYWQVRQPVYRTSVDRWKRYEPWLGPFEELVGL